MWRYLNPGLLLLASIFLISESALLSDGRFALTCLVVGLALYAAATLWWVAMVTAPGPPIGVRLLALWAPAVAPTVVLVDSVAATKQNDSAALAVVIELPIALAVFLACLIGAGLIFLREDSEPNQDQ
ncbi:MAG: hypothetical protein ABI655_05990 [Phenylobacterium sp.]